MKPLEASSRASVGICSCIPPPHTHPPSRSLTVFYEQTAVVEIQSPTGGCKHSCLFSIFSLILSSHPLSVSIHASQLLFPAGFRVVCNIHPLIAYITFSFPTIFYLRNEKKERKLGSASAALFKFQDAKRNGKHGTSSCTRREYVAKTKTTFLEIIVCH